MSETPFTIYREIMKCLNNKQDIVEISLPLGGVQVIKMIDVIKTVSEFVEEYSVSMDNKELMEYAFMMEIDPRRATKDMLYYIFEEITDSLLYLYLDLEFVCLGQVITDDNRYLTL